MSDKSSKNNFVFYLDWCDILDDLPDDQALILMRAINRFVKTKQDTKIENPTLQAVFNMIKRKIIEDAEKYEEVCRKRSEARKGKNQEEEKTNDNKCEQMKSNDNKCEQMKSNVTDSDSDSVCDSDNDLFLNKKESKKEKRKKFVPPTVEEVRSYCREKNYDNVDPDYFVAYYEASNWTKGNNVKVQNWKALTKQWNLRTWNNNKSPPKTSDEEIDEFIRKKIEGEI